MAFGVYLIEITREVGKDVGVYIGSTTRSFEYRWNAHKTVFRKGTHQNRILQGMWTKYGPYSFKFHILEECTDRDAVIPTEQKWLDEHKAMTGVLVCNIGDVVDAVWRGKKLSEEHKQKLSAAKRGKPHYHSPETLKKMVESRKKRGTNRHSESARKKMSESHTGKVLAPEHAAKIRAILSRARTEQQYNRSPEIIENGSLFDSGT